MKNKILLITSFSKIFLIYSTSLLEILINNSWFINIVISIIILLNIGRIKIINLIF